MDLKDILAMEVPKDALRTVATANKLKPGGNAIEDYANIIALSEKTKDMGLLLAEQYQYAGKTAVNWYRPLSGIEAIRIGTIEQVKKLLIEKYGPKILTSGLQPKPEDLPRLVKAIEIEGSLVLVFTYLGPARRVLENYQIVKRSPQLIDYVVLHFAPFAVEIRSGVNKTKVFKDAVITTLGIDPSKVEWEQLSRLSESEVQTLASAFKAGLVGCKSKSSEGIYSTEEVVAQPNIKNLWEQEEHKKRFDGKTLKKQILSFEYRHSFGLVEDIHFVVNDDGVAFTNPVTENIISLMYQYIVEIKIGKSLLAKGI